MAPRFALGVIAIISLATFVAAAEECPKLDRAVATVPDFNDPHLGLQWFLNRGLRKGTRYGCMVADATETARYHFASGCGCASHETCHSRALEYSTSFADRHSSRMGECRCCSWWVIMLIVVGCILFVVAIIQFPRLRKYVQKKMRERRMKSRSSIAAMEEGDARDFSGLGQHQELNGSRDDRHHSEMRPRRVARRTASSPSGATAPIARRRAPGRRSPVVAERAAAASGNDVSDADRTAAYRSDRPTSQLTPQGSPLTTRRTPGSSGGRSVTPPTADTAIGGAMTPRHDFEASFGGAHPDQMVLDGDEDIDTR